MKNVRCNWIPTQCMAYNQGRAAPYPRKSRTKPQKLRPIPGTLDKTSQEATHPRKSRTKPQKKRPIPGNPGQNLTRSDTSLIISDKTSQDFLFAGCWLVRCCRCRCWLRQGMQRPPAGAKMHQTIESKYFERLKCTSRAFEHDSKCRIGSES